MHRSGDGARDGVEVVVEERGKRVKLDLLEERSRRGSVMDV